MPPESAAGFALPSFLRGFAALRETIFFPADLNSPKKKERFAQSRKAAKMFYDRCAAGAL
jgi:hypothetical protein